MRDAVVVVLVGDGADDAVLRVAPLQGLDPGFLAQARHAPVRPDTELGTDNVTVAQYRFHTGGGALDAPDGDRCLQRDAFQCRDGPEQGQPGETVLHHLPQRLVAQVPVVIVQEQRRVAVGNPDLVDRLHVIDPSRDAQAIQHPPACGGNGGGTTIEGRRDKFRGRFTVHDHRRDPGTAQRGGQAQAHQATPNDQYPCMNVCHGGSVAKPARVQHATFGPWRGGSDCAL